MNTLKTASVSDKRPLLLISFSMVFQAPFPPYDPTDEKGWVLKCIWLYSVLNHTQILVRCSNYRYKLTLRHPRKLRNGRKAMASNPRRNSRSDSPRESRQYLASSSSRKLCAEASSRDQDRWGKSYHWKYQQTEIWDGSRPHYGVSPGPLSTFRDWPIDIGLSL